MPIKTNGQWKEAHKICLYRFLNNCDTMIHIIGFQWLYIILSFIDKEISSLNLFYSVIVTSIAESLLGGLLY